MSTVYAPNPRLNRLLAALPDVDFERWLPQLEWVAMPLGQVLYPQGRPPSHAYFPTSSLVALLYEMENGATSEIAVVGNEGMVGVALFMGGGATPSRAAVQSAGEGFRLPAQVMTSEFDRSPHVAKLMLRFTQTSIASMLGVRREGVTEAARKLHKDGLIHCARGHISVLDRPGLEHRSCECYGVVKREYDRLLPPAVGPAATPANDSGCASGRRSSALP